MSLRFQEHGSRLRLSLPVERAEALREALKHRLQMLDEDRDPASREAEVVHAVQNLLAYALYERRSAPDRPAAVAIDLDREQAERAREWASRVLRETFRRPRDAGDAGADDRTPALLHGCVEALDAALERPTRPEDPGPIGPRI